MNKKFKFTALALALCLSVGSLGAFAACGEGGNSSGNDPEGGNVVGGNGKFAYMTEKLSTMENPAQDYNANLFFVNSLEFQVADPSVIYISEGKDQGWFYAYGTSDEIGGHGIQAWKSKDLAHWETTGVALKPNYETTWAVDNYWAPEVIYDEDVGGYYMFYNAFNLNETVNGETRLCLSVAYSETPDGPFVSPTSKNLDGKQLSESEPVYDLRASNKAIPAGVAMDMALDVHPFVDPKTGDKYLYWGWYNVHGDGTHLFGMKMKDWYTPDYSTITELTAPGYSTLAQRDFGLRDRNSEGHVNEGPHMMYHDGKYYLTFSVNDYTSFTYRVIQAIADSPLGTYTKIDENKGGKLLSTSGDWYHIASAGHHAFITVGDELFVAYHTFKDRVSIAGGRALALDRVVWTKNADGVELMHTNGPTWSLQALPEAISGYKNIALDAAITANKTENDEAYLNDGIVKYQETDCAVEYEADTGTSTIKLTWDDWKTARAIMIYNSFDYFYAFESVKKVEIQYMKANGSSATVSAENITFDKDWFVDDEWEFINPGGSAILEFNEMPVKSITITVESKKGEHLALNEIVVLGKDAPCAGVDKFESYSYTNPTFGSAHIVRESKNFGTAFTYVDGEGNKQAIETMYGYDVSHDDGTENAYITNNGAKDQYAYFKDIYATSFYIEADFTMIGNRSFAKDSYPKLGIAITAGDSVKGTLFYYIDAQKDYTLSQVGYATSKSDYTWDFMATEVLKQVPGGISYKNGNSTKLAVLRRGAQFWFFCNGKLMLESNTFPTFVENQRAAVGFLCFNTPMKVSNYFASADSAVIAEKYAELVG